MPDACDRRCCCSSHAATARITHTRNACPVSSYVAGKRLEQTLAGHPRILVAQEGLNDAYGPGEQLWLTCAGQEHKTTVSVEHLRRSNALYMEKCVEPEMA